jgi:hypothetical protein
VLASGSHAYGSKSDELDSVQLKPFGFDPVGYLSMHRTKAPTRGAIPVVTTSAGPTGHSTSALVM